METGLYYLQSRYYDPEMGRFINADALVSTAQDILGNNMFAYCNNNPVYYEDTQGESATIAGGVCGAIFGFLGAAISELTDDKEDEFRWDKVWQCTLSSAAAGAAAGFIADASIATFGVVPAIFISAGGGALASGANSYYVQKTLTGEHNWGKTVSDALLGGVTNGLCTGMSSQFKPLAKGVIEGIKYTGRQVSAELAYGLNTYGKFILDDFVPTLITGFGAWMGGMEYDFITK